MDEENESNKMRIAKKPAGPDLNTDDVKMEDHPFGDVSRFPDHALTAVHFEDRIAKLEQNFRSYIRQELSPSSLTSPKTKSSMVSFY